MSSQDILGALRQPFACKSLRLKNRFAMSPMTRWSAPGGLPTEQMAAYYRRRAEGDVGLIFSEGVGIDRPSSRCVSFVPNFCNDALPWWKTVLEGVHAAGASMVPQLWHVGGVPAPPIFPGAQHEPLESPSGLIGPAVPGGAPMTESDIAEVIASYGRAAADARRLGFDGVEVHAAHGYLVDQFFWDHTNKRTDRYGGADIGARARFGAEVFREMRRRTGPDFALLMRISQWKTDFYDARIAATATELEQWLAPLVEAGVDVFDCSQRRFWEPEFAGSDLNFAGWVKKVSGRPTITVGSIGLDRDLFADFTQGGHSKSNTGSLLELARRFERGDFDLVAIGRVLLADPQWLLKVQHGRLDELEPYSAAAMQTLY